MRRRVTREDVAEATRLIGGGSPRGDWWVCDGYKIQGDEIVSEYAAPMPIMGSDPLDLELLNNWRAYDPLEETPDLFLKIASLCEEPDFSAAAVAFCHKYGVPGGSSVLAGGAPDRMKVSSFLTEAQRARNILELYEATINEDFDTMVDLLAAPPDTLTPGPLQQWNTEFFSGRPFLDLFLRRTNGRGFVRFIALATMSSSVDLTVRTLCHLVTSPKFNEAIFEPHTLESRWHFDNLLGAAYLQMHWLMTSGDALARCEYCSRVLSLARPHPEGRKRRRDKRFCDDACRQAHHRSRKKP